jgi:hypothetical protein
MSSHIYEITMQPHKYTPPEKRWLPIIQDHLADIKAVYNDL